MDNREDFEALVTRAGSLQATRRRMAPLLWQAGAVDGLAVNLLRAFFLTGERPHYRELPQGWLATQGAYTTPELRANPGTFFRPVGVPDTAQVRCLSRPRDGQRLHISFKSLYRTYNESYQKTYDSFVGNETVHARIWRHHGAPRPTVICLHGWGGGLLWLEEQIFAASQLFKAGLNVVVTTLPFHGPRKPVGRFNLNLFPSSDLRRTNEGFGQAIADLRSLMGWLRQTGTSERIGIIAMSLGGYVASLLASLEPTLDFVMPVITPVSLADLLWNLNLDVAGTRESSLAGFDRQAFRDAMAVHCPLSHSLQIPKERVHIVGGKADRVVSPAQVSALWEHWGRPRISWYPGGHYMHYGRTTYLNELCQLARVEPPKWDEALPGSPLLRWLGRFTASGITIS